jgi:HlyD family secretion protein
VYNIKVAKPGATVQSGEELLSIFPKDEALILEGKVLNRDIGFIKPGMKVKVKLETFPYQEFGILNGTVVKVSPNAVQEQEIGLIYPVQVELEQDGVQINGAAVELTPGMAATAEIVIRQKTILSFLIEPLVARWDSAFSVR